MAAIPGNPILNVEQEDELIQRKLNNVELPLRKCVRQIAQILAAPTSAVEGDSAMTSVAGFEVDEAAKAAQVWSVFSAQLREVELGVKKVGIVERMEARMRAKYEAKGRQMESNKAFLQQEIVALRAALASAELTRQRKLAYDVVARQVLAVGDRASLQQEINGHREEHTLMASRRDGIRTTLEARKAAFGRLLADLKVLRELVPPAEEVEKKEEEIESGQSPNALAAAGSQAPTPVANDDGEKGVSKSTTPAAEGPDEDEDEDRARRTAPASKATTPATTTAPASPAPEVVSPPVLLDPQSENVDSELLNVEATLGDIGPDVAMDAAERHEEEEAADEERETPPLSGPAEDEAMPASAAVGPSRRSSRSRSPTTSPIQSTTAMQDDDGDSTAPSGAGGARPKRGATVSSRKSSTSSEPPSKKPRT